MHGRQANTPVTWTWHSRPALPYSVFCRPAQALAATARRLQAATLAGGGAGVDGGGGGGGCAPRRKQITRARAQGEEGDLAEPKYSCEPVEVRGGGHDLVMRRRCLLQRVPFGVVTGHSRSLGADHCAGGAVNWKPVMNFLVAQRVRQCALCGWCCASVNNTGKRVV